MLLDTKLPFTYIVNRIMPDVVRVLLISIFFQVVKFYFAGYLPQIPLQLPTILGGCISLLLAFKISQSYDRWWEARKVWGGIVNDSRTLLLQVSTFVPDAHLRRDTPDSVLHRLAYRQMAWCYSLGQSLRGLDPLAGLASYLTPAELAELPNHANKPLALLALHTAQLKTLYQQQALNDFQQVQLDSTLLRLCDSMGRAERIKSTIFPTSYRLLVYLFIYVFLTTLSLGLVETIGIWEAPLLLTIATSFFLLERTARYLQDPFNNKPTDTPVTAIARTIEINLRQLLHETEVPAPLKPESYYLM
ncbi:bestrophin family ion channel [Hymenobacter sp. ASUV-10]|uniref:Bestrophin family ion channel n=1 Tax=Hymenobacter aranciens TaxID=3063996 RepID=A0ABT9BJ00_9BACT|nr:bestrophin family ion channel [Hymenobacter sp. ASUV-10]MDO7876493.1 bestrophin family ion channel [Hymenobacter sp. ASUV-10]